MRREAGMCVRCGAAPAVDGRSSCEPCLAKRRESDRDRYHKAKDAGLKYGGKSVAVSRKAARKRQHARRTAGLCTRCGHRPPVEGKTICEPCREVRRIVARTRYAARRAGGLCTTCGGPAAGGGSRCGPCAVLETERRSLERKNAASRRLYWKRRAGGRCTVCNAPSQGAARCGPCARRSYERSDHVRGMPLYPPMFTVFLIGTDEPLAIFDDEMEVAAFIAFEKLRRNQVEVVRDASPLATLASRE